MGVVVYGVDFRKHLDREEQMVRLAKEVMGLIEDTAPCEMPPVWPGYVAPDRDPA